MLCLHQLIRSYDFYFLYMANRGINRLIQDGRARHCCGGARKINHGSPPVRTTFLSPKGESVYERGLCALRWGVAIK